jgi:uncharacterized protein
MEIVMAQIFSKSLTLPINAQACFEWHERQGAFERLSPPWDPVEILHKDDHIKDDARVSLKVKVLPGIRTKLEVLHQNYRAGISFEDRQIKGPFTEWVHTHHMQDLSPHLNTSQADIGNQEQCMLTDSIRYRLPFGALGQWGGGEMVKARLNQLFNYRHQVMLHDLQLHSIAQGQKLTIAVSGAKGFIGAPLCALLTTGGHKVIRLVRTLTGASDERVWKEAENVPDLSDVDAVIHLAGENVAQRWSIQAKERIVQSRVKRTQALAHALADYRDDQNTPKVQTLIVASGIGYYGDCPEGILDESAPLGEGFLASVCQAWEEACTPAQKAGIRVVNMRIGIVLSPQGGALAQLLPPFLVGGGGPVSHGKQWMSWISLHDAVGALYFALFTKNLVGPVNIVAPNAVSNRTFSKVLANVLRRPCIVPIPAMMLKLMYGEMAKETILSGQNVSPTKLQTFNYPFMHQELELALRFVLGKVFLNS